MPYHAEDIIPSIVPKNFVAPLYRTVGHERNIVKRVLALPCSLPVEIYVEALFPAALKAFYSILSPDPKEIFHKTSGKSFVCSISTSIKDGTQMPGDNEGSTTRFIYRNVALYDIATWWFFIADVIGDGLINYTSTIYNVRECNAKNNPNYGSGGLWGGAIHTNGGWGQIDFAFSAPSKFAPVSPSGVIVAPGRGWTIAASLKFNLDTGDPVPTENRIIYTGTSVVLDYHNNAGSEPGIVHGPNRVWHQGKNNFSVTMAVSCEWQCTVGGPPSAQAFPDGSTAHCTLFSQSP